MFKRIFLFAAVNILMVVTISFVLNLLGLGHYMTDNGLDYQALMIFCLVWGMGGAFISLLISKWMAKTMMGVKIIDPYSSATHGQYGALVQRVHHFAKMSGLSKMPEVGVYDSPEVNAFATGPSRNNSMVAVSTGLLHNMDSASVEGVLAHEVAHIANGDMVTMTLVQGVINAFVMFFARIAAYALDQFLRGSDSDNQRGGGLGFWGRTIAVMVFEMAFGILGMLVASWFSRYREFRADAGGARLAGRDKMVQALRSLQHTVQAEPAADHSSLATLKISNKGSFLALFSTHPTLDARIKALL